MYSWRSANYYSKIMLENAFDSLDFQVILERRKTKELNLVSNNLHIRNYKSLANIKHIPSQKSITRFRVCMKEDDLENQA